MLHKPFPSFFGSSHEKTLERWGEEATLCGYELLLESAKIARETVEETKNPPIFYIHD